MTGERHAAGLDEGLRLIGHARAEGARDFTLMGRRWELAEGVFSPVHTHGTEFYTRALPYPIGGRFLEVGSGAGVTSVTAALAGCAAVTAVDVNPSAVTATARNAARHGVPWVRALVGDVFSAVRQDAPYDAVFWNIPYVSLPEAGDHDPDLAKGVFDIGHRCLRAYLGGAADVLAPGGRLFLGLGDIGDRTTMETVAAANRWHAVLLAALAAPPDPHVEHRLFELVRATAPDGPGDRR
ncbi:methyltransferase [Actinomadura harenae]|uniref:Methyltransferase domain-containing protein n=1 Tax=Actinomadura harenae TaxID=2483351 RepID=A0A3M2LYF2_9ACTN|nr:methyltransferase [Actinomadura harenae]RMI41613.1 methyltransferase domain-containing protein [Actinomadura harenae]